MDYNFGKCAKVTNKINISKSENKTKVIIHNPKKIEILVVQVNKCLNINGKRCDWLFIIVNNNKGIFIELKGRNIIEGFKQLGNSILEIENIKYNFLYKKFSKKECYLILNNYAPLSSNMIKKQIRYFKISIASFL